MPATSSAQKSKRADARFPLKKAAKQPAASDEDIEMDEDVESDEEAAPEKDEAERKLERMLFGDDEGFMDALKSQQKRADGMQLTLQSDDEDESAGEEVDGQDEDDMANMADEDVCCSLRVLLRV